MKSVLVVEDVSETRHWLVDIAREAFGECDVREAPDRRSGLAEVEGQAFDLALIDLGLPDGSGLDVLRALKERHPAALCIVTTIMGDDVHIVAALSAGADGYLLKETAAAVVTKQLSQLAEGIPALSPSVAQRIMQHFRATGPSSAPDGNLTVREREILGLIGRGLRNAEVAAMLTVSEGTVASHIKSIYRKLGISSRAEASWHAMQLGLSNGGRGDQ
ncbi:response regulator transcription factor [Parvularcula sp. LCG005]|uniref:response regulator transcription factor n=1 Tax=Parvularcula sp. LCG005 TaxID=3078805 RepID=UPI002943B3F9|nr:response regulator transcription factor [Parvularcula sp. LCG005]WOI54201.1 response regulator transcription factor [Parvularcula sp. LCG005]